MLEMEPRALHVLGRRSATELSLALQYVCYESGEEGGRVSGFCVSYKELNKREKSGSKDREHSTG